MYPVLITILALAGSVLSSSDGLQQVFNLSALAGRYRSMNPTLNQWEVEGFRVHRFNKSGRPKLTAEFQLYRSRIIPPCSMQKDMDRFLLLGMVGETCGYFVPDQPVLCRDGVYRQTAGGVSHWQNPSNAQNYWSTCETYPRAIEGEQDVSEERKRFLKWRMIDLEEGEWSSSQASLPELQREIPFKSAKLEVLNGVPLKKYVSCHIMANNANESTQHCRTDYTGQSLQHDSHFWERWNRLSVHTHEPQRRWTVVHLLDRRESKQQAAHF
jgi:hypothetical protein